MRKKINILLPIITAICIFLIWEMVVRIREIPMYILPSPSQILMALKKELIESALLSHMRITMIEALLGINIAIVLAVFLGVLMDAFPSFKRCIYPILVVTQTVPVIVLAPLFIIYLGFGLAPKILTVVSMCFFPIVISFADGMANVNEQYINLVKSFGAGKLRQYWLVKFPASLPTFLSGLKVAATYSISGAVVGEWISAKNGLGYYMIRVKNAYMLDKLFACVVIIILLSLLMNGFVRLLQYITMPYARKRKSVAIGK